MVKFLFRHFLHSLAATFLRRKTSPHQLVGFPGIQFYRKGRLTAPGFSRISSFQNNELISSHSPEVTRMLHLLSNKEILFKNQSIVDVQYHIS